MKLRDWRTDKGWTQQRLADELECSVITIARYEIGTRDPEPEMKKKIFVLSEGRVEPNDFYDLPAWRRLFARIGNLVRGKVA